MAADDDKSNIGYDMIGVFLPLIGFILYFIWKDDKPVRAKSVGIWSLVGLGLYLVFGGSIPSLLNNPLSSLTGKSASATELQQIVLDGYNEELKKSGSDVTCVRVELVKESENKFSGFAELSDGSKPLAKVTVGEDGNAIWRVGLMALD